MIKKYGVLWSLLTLHCSARAQEQPFTRAKEIGTVTVVAAPLKKLTLTESIAMALEQRPSVKSAAAATESKKYLQRLTLSSMLPNVTVAGTVEEHAEAHATPSTIGVNASQVIFKFDLPDTLKAAAQETEISKKAEVLNKYQIRFDIEKSFLNAWLVQRQYKLTRSLLKSSQAIFEQQKAQNAVELIDKSVWLKAEAQYANDQATVEQYRDSLHAAFVQLERNLGRKISRSGSVDCSSSLEKWPTLEWKWNGPVVVHDLDYYYQLALKHRKELEIQDSTIKTFKHKKKAALKQYLPSFNLFGSMSRFTSGTVSPRFSHSGGVQMSWNIFDGFSNYLSSKSAESLEVQAILDKEELHNSIRSDVHVTYAELMKLHKQLIAQKRSLTAAKNDYTLKREQLNLGLVPYVQFQEARTTWFTNEFSWLTLKITAVQKYAELLFKSGYPDNTLL